MALDTATKRLSAMSPMSPWRIALPLPDGTVDQGDRQAVLFLYSGVLAGVLATVYPILVGTITLSPALLATVDLNGADL